MHSSFRPVTRGHKPTSRFRKSPRLKDFDYVGPLAAHVICVTDFRTPFFSQAALATIAMEAMHEAAGKLEAAIYAYCFMPDHVHLLVGIAEGGSLEVFAQRFKQLAGYRVKQVTGASLWQPSFYDHILRREEALGTLRRTSGRTPSRVDWWNHARRTCYRGRLVPYVT